MILASLIGALFCRAMQVQLGEAALGLGAGFFLFIPLFVARILGAGDVKLLMALGFWSHPGAALAIGVVSLFMGALLAFVVLFFQALRKKTSFFYRVYATLFSLLPEMSFVPLRLDASIHMPFAVPMMLAWLFLVAPNF